MNWKPLPSPFPEIVMWGAKRGDTSAVVSYDSGIAKWAASIRPSGQSTEWLGHTFDTRKAAEDAIRARLRQ